MNDSRIRLACLAAFGLLLVLLLVLVWQRKGVHREAANGATTGTGATPSAPVAGHSNPAAAWRPKRGAAAPAATAEEIVAAKLQRFAQSRREIMRAMARQKNIAVPDAVERFFDAVEAGDWNEIETAFNAINGGDGSAGQESKRLPEVTALWASIIDAYGAAEQVHDWPAQKLLDYGNARS